MNWRVISVAACAIVALLAAYLFTIGPLGGRRLVGKPNPVSLKATPVPAPAADTAMPALSRYQNRDVRENYYSVRLPQDWSVLASPGPGGYLFVFPGGKGTVELHDVPDNTTLELFILSQEEPKLRNSIPGYRRLEYSRDSIGSNPAYRLVYLSSAAPETLETERVYVTGQDQAGLITLSAPRARFVQLQRRFAAVTGSFAWENR